MYAVGPSGGAETLPAHTNEYTAMRHAGAAHAPLFGGASPSRPVQQSIQPHGGI